MGNEKKTHLIITFVSLSTGYQTPQIIANATQRVIEAGSNLTLTCVYAFEFEHGKDNLQIVWDYPQSLSITPTKV